MLPKKGLRQDEAADGEEEQNVSADAIDQAVGEVLVRRKGGPSPGNRLPQNVREQSRNYVEEARYDSSLVCIRSRLSRSRAEAFVTFRTNRDGNLRIPDNHL
jgi:hypothetical protein